jgi:hypothetical protein
MDGMARRLLAALTAAMPPSRRGWGNAMLAELSYTQSRLDRARLVLGAVHVVLLPPPGLASYGRAAGRAALVTVIAWIPVGAALYLSNVVFPSPEDNAFGVLAMDAYLILTLMAAGAAARRAAGGVGHSIVAGITAGLIIAVLGMGTFAIIDNLFLSVVSHQTAKIDGFRASGMTSMRAYINADLESTAPGVALVAAFGGAFLGIVGAMADRELSVARARARHRPRL